MKFSEQWLREWVNPSIDTQTLADQLTMAGLEVDAVESVASILTHHGIEHSLDILKEPYVDISNLASVEGKALLSFMASCDLRRLDEATFAKLVKRLERRAIQKGPRLIMPEWLGVIIAPQTSTRRARNGLNKQLH